MVNKRYTLSEIERQTIAENEMQILKHGELANMYAQHCLDAVDPKDETLAFNQMRRHAKTVKSYELHNAQIRKWVEEREIRIQNMHK